MSFSAKISATILLFLVLAISPQIIVAAQQNPQTTTIHLTGHVEYVNNYGGFFAIIGDDGQKYQPTNLPGKVRTNGLPIKFDATLNDNLVSAFLWGKIVDVSNVTPLKAKISNDERSAIYVLLKRMDAFNTKDLVALQQIDTLAAQLTKEEFTNWIGNYNNYNLQYVEMFSADSFSLTGACYYTRELNGEMRLEGNTQVAATTFTISKTKDGWKVTELQNLKNPNFTNSTLLLADLKQKAFTKYNTNQLSSLLQ